MREQRGDAPLNPPQAIFEVDIEHVALLALDAAHRQAADRDSEREIDREPGFSQLLPTGEDRQSLGQIVRYRPPQWLEARSHDGVGARRQEAALMIRWSSGAGVARSDLAKLDHPIIRHGRYSVAVVAPAHRRRQIGSASGRERGE